MNYAFSLKALQRIIFTILERRRSRSKRELQNDRQGRARGSTSDCRSVGGHCCRVKDGSSQRSLYSTVFRAKK